MFRKLALTGTSARKKKVPKIESIDRKKRAVNSLAASLLFREDSMIQVLADVPVSLLPISPNPTVLSDRKSVV